MLRLFVRGQTPQGERDIIKFEINMTARILGNIFGFIVLDAPTIYVSWKNLYWPFAMYITFMFMGYRIVQIYKLQNIK